MKVLVVSALCIVLLWVSGCATAENQHPNQVLQPQALLQQLVGSWRFEFFPVGAKRATHTGTRTFAPIVAEHPMLTWTESFAGRDVVITGTFGYDASRGEFYETGHPSGGPVEFWWGQPSLDGHSISWQDTQDSHSPARGEMRVLSKAQFEYQTESYRAVFTRLTPNGPPAGSQ